MRKYFNVLCLFILFFVLPACLLNATTTFNYPKFKAFDTDGTPLDSGKLYTYIAGTSTAQTTYQDKDYSTPHTNPIILDANGEATIYLLGTYKLILKDSDDNTLWTLDDIPSSGRDAYKVYVDPTVTDQGAATVNGNRSVKDLVDANPSRQTTLVFDHSGAGITTDYTFQTSESITENFTLEMRQGTRLVDDVNNATVEIFGHIDATPQQVISNWRTGSGELQYKKFSTEFARQKYYVDPYAADQGAATPEYPRSIKDFVDSIGTSLYATLILSHNNSGNTTTYTFSTSETIPANIDLMIQNGAVINVAAGTLTFEDPAQIMSSDGQQIFTSSNQTFENSGTIRVDWWGRSYTAAERAFDAAGEGSSIYFSGGTWNFGDEQLQLLNKTVNIYGVGHDQTSYGGDAGTVIKGTGTRLFFINEYTSLFNLMLDNSGAECVRIGNYGGSGSVHWGGVIQNCYFTNATTAGLVNNGSQLGKVINCFFEGNVGDGVRVLDTSGNSTYLSFYGCRFYNNGGRGVRYDGDAYHRYYGCIFESNAYESLYTAANVTYALIHGCHFEGNNTATATAGYDIFFGNSGCKEIFFTNNWFGGPANPFDGATGNKHFGIRGKIYFTNNKWSSPPSAPYIRHLGSDANFDVIYFNEPQLASGDLEIDNPGGTQIIMQNGLHLKYDYTTNATVQRCSRLLVTNSGASGALDFAVPPATVGHEFTAVIAANQQLRLTPASGDRFAPLGTTNQKIQNATGTTGESITYKCISTTVWAEVSRGQSTWTAVP
jgi:hypothetical protein